MPDTRVDISSELKLLKSLPYQVARREMAKILRRSALPIKRAIVAAAPIAEKPVKRYSKGLGVVATYQPGNLKKSVGIKLLRARGNDVTDVIVAPLKGAKRKYDGFYRHFVEHGTKKWSGKPFIMNAAMTKFKETESIVNESTQVVIKKFAKKNGYEFG